MSKTQKVLLDIEDSIATVTINRPDVLNAVDLEVFEALEDAGYSLRRERNVRVVILTGAGDRAFCAGMDLKAAREGTLLSKNTIGRPLFEIIEAVKRSNKVYEEMSMPVIAAIQGYCLGAGFQLALACDIRIAAEDAVFGLIEVTRLGSPPDYGGTQRLPRIIGTSLAKLFTFTGRQLDASKALSIGLVDEVYPKSQLMSEVRKLAQEIASNDPEAVQATKRLMNAAMSNGLETGLAYESATAASFRVWDNIDNASADFTKKQG